MSGRRRSGQATAGLMRESGNRWGGSGDWDWRGGLLQGRREGLDVVGVR